jgi:hypothetical protein
MSTGNHLPRAVNTSLDARLAPFQAPEQARREKLSLVNDLKLLFAALGAGGSVVPMGDNRRTAHLLARYAESLRPR